MSDSDVTIRPDSIDPIGPIGPRFFSYSSISNVESKKNPKAFPGEWIAEEKIHGANFSFTFDVQSGQIIPGKRSSFLTSEGKFHNHLQVYERYSSKLTELFKAVLDRFGSSDYKISEIIIYGEIFGGELKKKPVQTGIFYCPHREFIPFDIAITPSGSKRYLSYPDSRKLFSEFGFYPVPVIATGKFSDLITLSTVFESHVPALLGCNEGVPSENYAEGYVLRPIEDVYINGGRTVFKYKNPRFAEIKPRKPSSKKIVPIDDDVVTSLYEDVQRYITLNRVNNILSHSPDGTTNSKRLAGLLTADIIKEYPWTFDVNNLNQTESATFKIIKLKLYNDCLEFVTNNPVPR